MTSEGNIPNHVLSSAREFVQRLKTSPEDEELQALYEQINQFGPDARSFLQFLTNTFLENDVLASTMQNPDSVQVIKRKFASYGVSEEQANMVVDYFNKKAGSKAGQVADTKPPNIA